MKKVLLIEDDSVTRTILKTLLSSEFEVLETRTAEEALGIYKKADLIICDFHLPGMTGYQFAEKIQGNKKPFIMLTTESSVEEKNKSKSLGINGWLTKPFSPDFLIKKIREILKAP